MDKGDVGVRLDRVLLRHLSKIPGVSRNRLQRLIELGAVQVNGAPVRRVAVRVQVGDRITVDLPPRRERTAPVAEPLPLAVCDEHDDLLIVDKPPGQVVHPTIRNRTGTLLNALLAYAGGRWTPALVSRLDKGTSGLVLVAKNKAMHATLQRLSNNHAIQKEYLALVQGKPPARGTIDLALDRDPWDRRRVTVRDRGGVPSVTRFVRLRSVEASGVRVSLLRCQLITGRMHQLRVHLSAKGWPILGDPTYGVAWPGLERQALHAWRLTFRHPTLAIDVNATAPPPPDMANVMTALAMH